MGGVVDASGGVVDAALSALLLAATFIVVCACLCFVGEARRERRQERSKNPPAGSETPAREGRKPREGLGPQGLKPWTPAEKPRMESVL